MTNCELDYSLGEFTSHYLSLLPEYEDHQIEDKKELDVFISMLNWMGIK